MNKELIHQDFIDRISVLLNNAKNKIISTVNHIMVLTYFEIGRMIVEEEQKGKERADYGKQLYLHFLIILRKILVEVFLKPI